jgi:hypothetical protein
MAGTAVTGANTDHQKGWDGNYQILYTRVVSEMISL